MDQLSFFETACAAMHLQIVHVPAEGWRLTVTSRQHGDQWGDTPPTTYERLTRGELFNLLCDEAAHRLRIS